MNDFKLLFEQLIDELKIIAFDRDSENKYGMKIQGMKLLLDVCEKEFEKAINGNETKIIIIDDMAVPEEFDDETWNAWKKTFQKLLEYNEKKLQNDKQCHAMSLNCVI